MKGISNSKTFLTSVQEFIDAEQLFSTDDRLLIGISGGLDSTVLVYALIGLGYDMGLCHVNFQLRGEASDGDARFVESLGKSLNMPVFVTKVDTNKLASENKTSIQEVARQTRYEYFEQIRQSEGYNYVCTAHHLDDQIETVFFRWIKGAGWKGLLGIPAVNDSIRRPFLSQTKESIQKICQQYDIPYREDASNQSDKYDRNYIRHHLIDPIARINPSYHQTFLHQNKVLKSSFDYYHAQVKAYWKDKVFTSDHLLYSDVSMLTDVAGGLSVVYELLSLFSFQSEACRKIYEDILSGKSGTLYLSKTHEVLLFRKELCIKPIVDRPDQEIVLSTLNTPLKIETATGLFTTEQEHVSPDYRITLHSLMLPLTFRTWRKGDFFHPAGMQGKTKKLSDYFNDEGINRFERDHMMLLCRDSHVLWVPGRRFDESIKFKDGGISISYFPGQLEKLPIDVFE